jgi:hypothetical protein
MGRPMTTTYSIRDVAERLGVSIPTVRKWRYAGKIPPPLAESDDGTLQWVPDDIDYLAQNGGADPAGTWPIADPVTSKNTNQLHVQFRAQRIAQPLAERTPPGQSLSSTARWITEQYLAAMANLEDLDNKGIIPDYEGYMRMLYNVDKQRRQEAAQ